MYPLSKLINTVEPMIWYPKPFLSFGMGTLSSPSAKCWGLYVNHQGPASEISTFTLAKPLKPTSWLPNAKINGISLFLLLLTC